MFPNKEKQMEPVEKQHLKNKLLWTVTGGSCHKYHFCCDKSFVATNTCLSWQTLVCHNKTPVLSRQKYACHNIFLSRQTCLPRQAYFCHNKRHVCHAASIIFVATKVLLQQTHVCRDKHLFVTTKHMFCHDKSMLVTTYFCHDKHMFAAASILLSQQKTCLSCRKYNFCCDKSFVATNTCLSRQTLVCHDKSMLVTTYFCHDKHMFAAASILLSQQKTCLSCRKYHFCCDKSFVATNTCLSRQTLVCHDKTHVLSRQKYACHNIFLSRQTHVCRGKNTFVTTKDMFVMTNMFVMTKLCCDKNSTCGSSFQWYWICVVLRKNSRSILAVFRECLKSIRADSKRFFHQRFKIKWTIASHCLCPSSVLTWVVVVVCVSVVWLHRAERAAVGEAGEGETATYR